MPKAKIPPSYDNAGILAYNAIVSRFRKDSDRAAAILAVSHLDVLVEWVLRAYLIDSKASADLFESNGPLSTFSGRMKLAYAVGLMQPSALHDFDTMRRIRNHFAHNVEANSFDEQPVSQWCSQLAVVSWPDLRPEDSSKGDRPREQFLATVAALSGWADWTLDRLKSGELVRCTAPSEKIRFDPS